MRKNIVLTVFILLLSIVLNIESATASKKNVKVVGGVPIDGLGMTMDASYDPRLDSLIPGYKIVSVAIVNESFNIVALSPESDKWYIKLKGSSKKIKAVSDLRTEDPKIWSRLPDKLKRKLAYPLYLPIGAKQVIDLFVPYKTDVEKFTHVIIDISSLSSIINLKASS